MGSQGPFWFSLPFQFLQKVHPSLLSIHLFYLQHFFFNAVLVLWKYRQYHETICPDLLIFRFFFLKLIHYPCNTGFAVQNIWLQLTMITQKKKRLRIKLLGSQLWFVKLFRETGEKDVAIKVLYCGICHTDLHTVKNEWGTTTYPVVPGYIFFLLPMQLCFRKFSIYVEVQKSHI